MVEAFVRVDVSYGTARRTRYGAAEEGARPMASADSMYIGAADSELGGKPPDSGAVVAVGGKQVARRDGQFAIGGLVAGLVLGLLVGTSTCNDCSAPADCGGQPPADAIPTHVPSAAPGPAPPSPATSTAASAAGSCGLASVTVAASHMQNSRTSNDVFVSIVGTQGSSPEVLISHGIEARVEYTTYVAAPAEVVGELVALNLRLSGNDGVNIGEIVCQINGQTFEWSEHLWLDGDSDTNPPARDYTFVDSSTLLTGASSEQLTITSETGNWYQSNQSASRVITVYGENGHVGPLQLVIPTTSSKSVSTFQIPELGTIQQVKVGNDGPGEWELESLEVRTQSEAPSVDQQLSWVHDGFLVPRTNTLSNGRESILRSLVAVFFGIIGPSVVRATNFFCLGKQSTLTACFASVYLRWWRSTQLDLLCYKRDTTHGARRGHV